VADVGLGGVGADSPAVWAAGSKGDWNQVRDMDGAEDSGSVQLDWQNH